MSSKLLSLIDGDTLVYRTGFAADKKVYIPHINGIPQCELTSAKELKAYKEEHEGEEIDIEHKLIVQPLDHCLQMVRTAIHSIQAVVGEFNEFYLTAGGRSNFRYEVATIRPYKGNRKDARRPTHYDAIRSYLVDHWNAKLVEGWEADDEICIRAYEEKARRKEEAFCEEGDKQQAHQEVVIVSVDKDLQMIAGYHYNPVKGEKSLVSPATAMRNFYTQMLAGDDTDNIPGIYGVGPKTAEKMLEQYSTEKAMWDVVQQAWHKHFPSGVEREDGTLMNVDDALLEVGRLLWLKRTRTDNLWLPPNQRNKE